MHGDTEAVVHARRGRRRQRGRAGNTQTYVRERVGGCGRLVESQPSVEDRGHGRDHGDAVAADARQRLDRMEVVDQRDRRAGVQRETEHDVQAVDVEQREHAERDVARFDAQAGVRLHLLDVREQGTVREHGRFRRTGGARGEQQDREIARGLWSRGVGSWSSTRSARLVLGRSSIIDDGDRAHRPVTDGAAGEVGVRRGREHEHGFDGVELACELLRR